MSEPTLKQLLEDPCGWTDYSCECIADMALERIEELEAQKPEPAVPVSELEELIETKSFRPKVGSKAVRVYRLQKLIDKAKGE